MLNLHKWFIFLSSVHNVMHFVYFESFCSKSCQVCTKGLHKKPVCTNCAQCAQCAHCCALLVLDRSYSCHVFTCIDGCKCSWAASSSDSIPAMSAPHPDMLRLFLPLLWRTGSAHRWGNPGIAALHSAPRASDILPLFLCLRSITADSNLCPHP